MRVYLNETLCPEFLGVNAAHVERRFDVRCDQPLCGTLETVACVGEEGP